MSMKKLAILVAISLSFGAACSSAGAQRYSRKQAQKSLGKLESVGIEMGEFSVTKVVDGDTIHVDGLDSSLRLLGVDTEETFKHEKEKREFEQGWQVYLKQQRGDSKRPVKMATPLGMDAKKWAEDWFQGVGKVRLERDHPAEIRDRYNRYLAYVLAMKNGKWLNYNVEAVRAGMGPYFPKYGRSRRYHDQFIAAEAEAKAAKRGIWADGVMAYPDYPEREAWWTARGDFVEVFRKEGEGKDNYIDITHWNAMDQLEAHVGKEVSVLGTVADIRIGEKGPSKVTLARRTFDDLPLMFFDKDVLGSTGVLAWKGEFVIATGLVSVYENKHTKKKQIQIVIDRASQVRLSPVPGLTVPTVNP